MSISENTTKINQLITKINDLPSAAPTVRRVESSFVVARDDEVTVVVDCGFKPDVVIFSDYLDYAQDGESTTIAPRSLVFLESPADSYQYGYVDAYDTNGVKWGLEFQTIQTENGFKIVNYQGYLYETSEWSDPTGSTFNYVAIKYT